MGTGDELEVGAILDDKYLIESFIGRGGMGSVYRARHVSLDSPRAIKILRRELAQDPGFVERFRIEALVAEEVRHPNIVALYDYSPVSEGRSYIVWEYVEGQTIGALLSRGVIFDPAEVAELVSQVADGLTLAHRKGIHHRDISPDNIMLSTDVRGRRIAKLLDFGLAKGSGVPGSPTTDIGTFIGKIGYASPEQMGLLAERTLVDERTDVFSLAAVTYAMLTGRAPFRTTNLQSFLRDLIVAPEQEVRERFLPRLTEPWRPALIRALARDRNQRTPNVKEFIGGINIAARATRTFDPPRTGTRSKTVLIAGAAGVLGVALSLIPGLGPGSLNLPSPPEPPSPTGVVNFGQERAAESLRGLNVEEKLASSDGAEIGQLSEPIEEPGAIDRFDAKTSMESGAFRGSTAGDAETPKPSDTGSANTSANAQPNPGSGVKDTSVPVPLTHTPDEADGLVGDSASAEPPARTPKTDVQLPPLSPGTREPAQTSAASRSSFPLQLTTMPRPVKKVDPEYPEQASRLGIQGNVILRAIIDAGGNVIDLRIVQSVPTRYSQVRRLLDEAAVEAARQWQFEPTLRDGLPVPVEVELVVQFRMDPY
ncbi:MAG TPA: TonB family protein [Vicinamibacteria bacterium]|nr:TonB family protein [Vicinamibacteria bacterium]